ncbi:GAF domain-containing protein [Marinigracilibium pacificum]|uniref:GAF domain-containing protein n=1 Tax=Marinigracilibium pacificum TaxID=2729599 RepID=A0A848IZ29_9BACT|nr:GAF domain-containing protein [Marinigracilibium pacificum]NMM48611.1 GAF domain-containing protein [Marinigracilibium pacificum]
MKNSLKKIAGLLFIIFLVGGLLLAYLMQGFKGALIQNIPSLNLNNIQSGQNVFNELFYTVMGVYSIALICIVFLFISDNKAGKGDENSSNLKDSSKSQSEEDDADQRIVNDDEIEDSNLKEVAQIINSEGDTEKILEKAITKISNFIEAGQAAIYSKVREDDKTKLNLIAGYALSFGEGRKISFDIGEGIVGTVGKEKRLLEINDIPDGYINIVSGLGKSTPNSLLVAPIVENSTVYGVVEIASFKNFSDAQKEYISECLTYMAKKLKNEAKAKKEDNKSENTND